MMWFVISSGNKIDFTKTTKYLILSLILYLDVSRKYVDTSSYHNLSFQTGKLVKYSMGI